MTAEQPKEHTITLTDEQVGRILMAIGDAQTCIDERSDNEDDYTPEELDDMHSYHREYGELRDDIKVLTGRAKRFDDHFTVIKDANGDRVEASHPEGAPVSDDAVHHVWTTLDCDGEVGIAPGFHWVNRLEHIMTVEAWTEADETTDWVY